MHFRDYINAVDNCINTALESDAGDRRRWREDLISYDLCSAITRGLKNELIEGLGSPMTVEWDAFKQTGKIETEHGDIAIIVQYADRRGWLRGVAFLEAKRAYPQKEGRYDAIDWEQLDRICKRTRYALLLLYNYEKICGYGDNVAFQQFSEKEGGSDYAGLSSYACVLQTPTALRIGEKDSRLHERVVPLSHQICNRYLRFMDLDTEPGIVAKAQGWIEKEDPRVARYLLVASIKHAEVAEPTPMEVNAKIYERIDVGKPFGSDKGFGGNPVVPKPKPAAAAAVAKAQRSMKA
jgi:hypothetical protein